MLDALPFRFLLLPGFELAALGAATAVLAGAGVAFCTTSLTETPVTADSGVVVVHGGAAPPMGPGETLVVLSGLDLDTDDLEAALVLLRRAARQGGRLWAIGGGVWVLAHLRLPEGTVLSANPVTAEALAGLRRVPAVSDAPFVRGEEIATARASAAAALLRHDLALGAGPGPDAAPNTLRGAEAARAQLPPIEDRYPTRHRLVIEGLGIMRANLFRPVSIAALAASLGLSERQLERLFERELGDTPAPVYREMRLEAARIEVRLGRRPMGEIARDFGFSSAGFSRTYLRQFAIAPSADRRAAMGGEE
ncbi:helix-turn-helix domain-containing protein [Rhodobacteraceae bacterium W635]|uniref:helix-turn-helix domain-containing protein n=1 Tax=Nioella halotolerans TaxID=2303578 RepID=UPI000E3EE19D|nr:helix-turn-helix domain-containing protein [Rhodobacteraceae bacterium W635]